MLLLALVALGALSGVAAQAVFTPASRADRGVAALAGGLGGIVGGVVNQAAWSPVIATLLAAVLAGGLLSVAMGLITAPRQRRS